MKKVIIYFPDGFSTIIKETKITKIKIENAESRSIKIFNAKTGETITLYVGFPFKLEY